jgi:hypothetical protein
MATTARTIRPDASEYSPAVENYIRLVTGCDVLDVLHNQVAELTALLTPLDDTQALTRHAPYTWTIKQVIGHMADCERVFGYRALRLARQDATPLPGFDENAYMDAIDFDRVPLGDLMSEFELLRRSHLSMIAPFDESSWKFAGTVNDHRMTTRAVVYVMAGHAAHHLAILHQRLQS